MILRLAAATFEEPSPRDSELLLTLLQTLIYRDADPHPPILRIVPDVAEGDQGAFERWLDRYGELGANVRAFLELGSLREGMLPVALPGVVLVPGVVHESTIADEFALPREALALLPDHDAFVRKRKEILVREEEDWIATLGLQVRSDEESDLVEDEGADDAPDVLDLFGADG